MPANCVAKRQHLGGQRRRHPARSESLKVAVETFRSNPRLDVETAVSETGVGEALVSFLDEKGIPLPVERALIKLPCSRIGPASLLLGLRLVGEYPVS